MQGKEKDIAHDSGKAQAQKRLEKTLPLHLILILNTE